MKQTLTTSKIRTVENHLISSYGSTLLWMISHQVHMLGKETPPSSPARTRADGGSITNYRARNSAGWTTEDSTWSREDGTWTKKRGVWNNKRDRVSLSKLIDHPSSSLRPRAGMERGIMVGQLYLRMYLFCQVETFCDYRTRRPVTCPLPLYLCFRRQWSILFSVCMRLCK